MIVHITGCTGFLGSHLARRLRLNPGVVLCDTPAGSDAVFHFAAISRSDDPEMLYRTNMRLLDELLEAATRAAIYFASTTHRRESAYHRSKRDGEARLATRGNACNLLLPNLFGPGSKPFHNSVVSTFCHQLWRGETPRIHADAVLELLYVEDLCAKLEALLFHTPVPSVFSPPPTGEITVSALLERFGAFKEGALPENAFECCLYNTLFSYRKGSV